MGRGLLAALDTVRAFVMVTHDRIHSKGYLRFNAQKLVLKEATPPTPPSHFQSPGLCFCQELRQQLNDKITLSVSQLHGGRFPILAV